MVEIDHREKMNKSQFENLIIDGKTTSFDTKQLPLQLEYEHRAINNNYLSTNLVGFYILLSWKQLRYSWQSAFINRLWKIYHKKVYALMFFDGSCTRKSSHVLVLVFARSAIAGALRFLFAALLLGSPIGVTFRVIVVLGIIIIRTICSLFTAGNPGRGSPDAEAIF